jgi:hypothetical protein
MKLIAIVLLLLGALEACAAQELALLTNINFKGVLAACLGEDPVAGNCPGSPYGPLSQWDTSRVTDMAGHWLDAAGNWLHGSGAADAPGGDMPPTNEANRLLHKLWKQSLEPSGLQPGLVLEPLPMDLLDHICKRCTGTCPKKKRNPAGFARALSAAVQAVQDVRDSEKPCDFCADPASTKCKGCEYACPLNPLPRILAS